MEVLDEVRRAVDGIDDEVLPLGRIAVRGPLLADEARIGDDFAQAGLQPVLHELVVLRDEVGLAFLGGDVEARAVDVPDDASARTDEVADAVQLGIG